MKSSFLKQACSLFVVLFILSGCSDSGIEEIKQWMDDTKKQTKVTIPKLSESKKFTPFIYTAKDGVDPFSPAKLAAAFAKLQSKSTNALKPDLDRRREPLETFPLDTVKMVGTMQKSGATYALLQVDKTVYNVKMGNYVGQNLGKIVSISETAVELTEVVQDASGDWVERKAKLELQETKK
jgi:type IV pilus assembly protein PilP